MTREQHNNYRLNCTLAIYLSALLGGVNEKDIAILCAFFAGIYTSFVRPAFVEPFLAFRVEMSRPRVPVAIVVFTQNIISLDHAPMAIPV